MKALIWENNRIRLVDKPIPKIQNEYDVIVKVKLSSICTSDLHIINGFVPKAIEKTTLGHEFVGEVVEVGNKITNLNIGDRVSANCETFCGECYFCKKGYINNCIVGGWKLGCSIDGCQAEYVRVPFGNMGLVKIPDNVTYKNALFTGDILSSGYFGVELAELKKDENIAIIGSGPVGLCSMACAKLFNPNKIIAIDVNQKRLDLAKKLNLADFILNPKTCDIEKEIKKITQNIGVDSTIEAAGGENTFELSWKITRPNGIVALVGMYEKNQILPLPKMYGKNLIFKTGGVDAVHCQELLDYISKGKINTDFLITQEYNLEDIEKAYDYFKNNKDTCLKIAIKG